MQKVIEYAALPILFTPCVSSFTGLAILAGLAVILAFAGYINAGSTQDDE